MFPLKIEWLFFNQRFDKKKSNFLKQNVNASTLLDHMSPSIPRGT